MSIVAPANPTRAPALLNRRRCTGRPVAAWRVAKAAALVFALASPALSGPAAGGAADWNQWRGPKRDGVSPDTGLLKSWPPGGPHMLWKATGLGGGFSGVSVSGGRLFTMGDLGDAGYLLALNLATGKPVWKAKVGRTGGGGGHPGPRCTPACDGQVVVALGQYGDLVCVSAADGRELWRKNMKSDFGGQMMSGWGYSESPLIDGRLVVCTPGGPRGTLVAIDKSSGAAVWQSKAWAEKAAYASVIPAELGGVKQYIQITDESVAGIAASSGALVWRAPRPGQTAVVPDPIYRDGIVFVTSGYGVGCNAFQVTAAGGRFNAREVYANKDLENHHGGVVLVGDHLYSLTNGNQLVCLEFKTGKVAWKDRSVGKGSITCADGHLIVRGERGAGTVALVEATPAGYKEKGRFDPPDRSDKSSWPHPVVAGGRLYLRDQDVLLCYDLKAK
jgi:outer membrane protein assembly factor BamB